MLLGTPARLATLPTPLPTVQINGVPLDRVTDSKLLGFVIDQHLSFKPHVEGVISKINQGLHPLRLAKYASLPQHLLRMLYYSLVHPHVIYGLPAYSSCSDSSLFNRIQTGLNKVVRLFHNLPPRSPSDELEVIFKEMRLLRLPELTSLSLLTHAFSIRNKTDYPLYFDPLQWPNHTYPTRFKAAGSLTVPKDRSNSDQRSVKSRSIREWNSYLKDLPSLLRSSSIISLKSQFRFLHS